MEWGIFFSKLIQGCELLLGLKISNNKSKSLGIYAEKERFIQTILETINQICWKSNEYLLTSLTFFGDSPFYFQCQWIAVDWNHFNAEGIHFSQSKTREDLFEYLGDEDDEELVAGAGKDWGDLGKINLSKWTPWKKFISDGMFKKMGGVAGGGAGDAGLGGSSGADLNDLDDEETDSDDEPMPELEEVPKTDEEKSKSTSNGATK